MYYSTVSGDNDLIGTDQQSTPPTSSLKLSREVSPYEVSHGKDQLSPSSNVSLEELEEEEDCEDDDENNLVLESTTAVVKAVVSLSTALPESKPSDYPELVKVCLL